MGKDAQKGDKVRFSDLAERKKLQKTLLTDAESERESGTERKRW